MNIIASRSGKVPLLYELGYITPCVGTLEEGKPCVTMFEFPTDVYQKCVESRI